MYHNNALDNTKLIEKFEESLKKSSSRHSLGIYSDVDVNKLRKSDLSAQNIIASVTAQMKSIQKADISCRNKRERRKKNDKYKQLSFVTVNALSDVQATQPKAMSKFDTQFVLDTQLIDFIENVEAQSDIGVTQEFETTFHNSQGNTNKINRETPSTSKESTQNSPKDRVTNKSIDYTDHKLLTRDYELEESNKYSNIDIDKGQTEFNDNCADMLNNFYEGESHVNALDTNFVLDEDIPLSYVFKPVRKSNTPSPLVYDLNKFEDFEKFALPIIEVQEDIVSAKHLINSQILGKEFTFETNHEVEETNSNNQTSPVLKINDVINNIQSPKQECKNNTFLKDEILFSSDEESEYIHKGYQDLPLTCALETSFYDHSEVLDKTMYVGFQTANNRSIQVSRESFEKAQSLLKDSEPDNISKISLTDLVNKCDNLCGSHRISQTNKEGPSISSRQSLIKQICCETELPCDGIRFRTSLNTFISEQSTDVKTTNEDTKEQERKNESDRKPNNKAVIESEFKLPIAPLKRKYDGFMTASNKKIKLSDQAIEISKQLFQDIDLDDKFSDDMKKTNITEEETTDPIKTETLNSQHIDDDILNEFAQDMSQREYMKETEFVSFKSDSKTRTSASEEAFAKTKNIFEDISNNKTLSDKNLVQDMSQPITNVGFKTGGEKVFFISEVAITKTKHMLQGVSDSRTDNNVTREKSTCSTFETDKIKTKEITEVCNKIGFKTASNKNINISDKALARSKRIFEDLDDLITDKTEEIKDFYHPTKQLNQGCNLNKVRSFIGFRTANNKNIKVSDEAYKKTKNMFKNIMDEQIEAPADYCTKSSNNHVNNIQSDFEIEESDRLQSEMCYEDFNTEFNIAHNKESLPVSCGFKTANNRPINISEKALAEGERIFADFQCNEDFNFNNLNNQVSLGKSNSKTNIQNELMPEMCGFKTASNKILKISKEAIAESKKLFADLIVNDDMSVTPSPDNNGTKSGAYMAKVNVNGDTIGEFANTKKNQFIGFKTASNKEVKVSEEALAKSKNILGVFTENYNTNDIENNREAILVSRPNDVQHKQLPTFSPFQTASQKSVTVSKDALFKTRNLFKDTVTDTQIGRDHDKELVPFKGFEKTDTNINELKSQYYAKFVDNDNVNKEIKFVGFQTASKKPVHISEAALAKSKLLFSDIDDTHGSKDNSEEFCKSNNENVSSSKKNLVTDNKLPQIGNTYLKDADTGNQLQFTGFQTASNRKVKVSEDALRKSKQLLQDINFDNNDTAYKSPSFLERNKENCSANTQTTFSFQTGNNNKIAISSKALEKSRRPLNENDLESNNLVEVSKDTNLERLIDTQVVNNFDMTLCTEDFCADTTPKLSKRSGSPILSCPKAKKRKKFETPYRSDSNITDKVLKVNKIEIERKYDTTMFSENYKKSKRYTLVDLAEAEKNALKEDVDTYLTKFTYDTLLDFVFSGKRNDFNDTPMTVDDIKVSFTNAVNKKLIPEGWLDNHIRLIIWKLITYEVKFSSTLKGVCSVRNVFNQLKFRYDKELYDAERPTLRKILERDDVASKTMVLCVAGIYEDGVSVCSVANVSSNVELLLTDGWYSVKTTIDKMLTKLTYDEKIKIGCKLVTNGAELVNCEQGVAPWEDTSEVRLKIFGNSTRLARWHARLGCHSNGAMLTPLSSVQPEGGKVSKIRAYVTRVYPALFVEKFDDGSTVTRSERLELIHQVKYETEKQSAIERMYEEVEKELSDQDSQDSESSVASKKNCHDISQYNSHLTNSQLKAMEERSNRRRDRMVQNIQQRIEEKIEKYGLNVKRNVVSLLKVRIAGVEEKNGKFTVSKGLMSIWKPNDAITDIIKEGSWLEVLNVVPTAVRYTEIQISAGRHSVFHQSKHRHSEKVLPFTKTLNRKCYLIKELTKNPLAHIDYNEVDTVGFVFHIEPSMSNYDSTKHPFQNVYLADAERNIICVNFWGGLKKFGYQSILDTGQVFACVNLQKRTGNTAKTIPHYRVTEFSYFTKTPKDSSTRKSVDELVKIMSGLDKRKFCEECLVLKNNFSKAYNVNTISPYRFNNDHNLTKNKMFIDSPVPQKISDDLNLTGLDFESTFKQDTQMSPNLLLRKKKVNEKIAKLKMYGEPPRLSPIHIINKSKSAFNDYKSPLISNAEASVASAKNNPANSRSEKSTDIQSSPVLCLNRTYVKSMNPVKLNFNIQDSSTDNVDQFAEEFDGSPPLSLD